MTDYYIKPGYKINITSEGELAQAYTAVPLDSTFQVSVYKYAAQLVKIHKMRNVLELGCGSGYKLVKYIYPVCPDITGVDQSFSLDYLRKTHTVGQWLIDDFDKDKYEAGRKYDLILAIDVIEHLRYPEKLLDRIKGIAHPESHIVISTPERDLVRGVDHEGPSPNKKHVREWNFEEFEQFMLHSGFKIVDHICVEAKLLTWRDRLNLWIKQLNNKTCQLIHVKVS